MFYFLCLMFLLLYCRNVYSVRAEDKFLCPVSRHFDFATNGDHYYPTFFFTPIYNVSIVNCSTVKRVDTVSIVKRDDTCAGQYPGCPVIYENLHDAVLSNLNWKKNNDICKLKKAWHDPHVTSRIAVFGGSVTYGMDADMCCSKPECEKLVNPRRCSWVHYLERWIHSTYKGNVTVENFAQGGVRSAEMAIKIPAILTKGGFTNLTSNDLIFLDHSVNDHGSGTQSRYTSVNTGVELSIRQILSFAQNISDPPQIIMLYTETRPVLKGIPALSTYNVYKKYAKYYGLRLFSYADAVSSNNSIEKQASYHQFLNHEARGNHPFWFIHLFTADLYAGILLKEFKQCSQLSENLVVDPYVLPPPLNNKDNCSSCNLEVTPLLKVDHANGLPNDNIGSFNISRNDSWQVRLDHKQRKGMIIELLKNSNYSIVHESSIEYKTNVIVGDYKFTGPASLIVTYMRSYANSGVFSIYFCDKFIAKLDALWSDYKTYRYTMPESICIPLFVKSGDKFSNYQCNRSSNESVTIEVKYEVQGYKGSMASLISQSPRGTQLVKIESVRICQL